jgi:hypothetical protein
MATDEKPVTHNLPPSKGQTYQAIQPRGKWIQREAKELAAVARGIDAPTEQKVPDSIPDVWKRALVFGDVLCSAAALAIAKPNSTYAPDADSMSLAQRIVGEWRGALAILALWDVRGWDWLQAKNVELTPAPPEKAELGFFEVLEKLMPRNAADVILGTDGSLSWARFHVLLAHGQPFALTSPMSLVVTAEDYHGRLEVPWMWKKKKDGRQFLIDPLNGRHLGRREKKWLAEWLAALHAGLTSLGATKQGRGQAILAQLAAFQQSATPEDVTLRKASLDMNKSLGLIDTKKRKQGDYFYELLNRAIAPVSNETDVEVAQTGSMNHYLLIEDSLPHRWNLDPRELVVYGGQTLADALEKPPVKPSELVPSTRTVFRCTKDFFLEKRILVLEASNVLPGGKLGRVSNAGLRTPIPPLREEALGLFSARELAENLEIAWVTERKIVVRLTLRVRSGPLFDGDQKRVLDVLSRGTAVNVDEMKKTLAIQEEDLTTALSELVRAGAIRQLEEGKYIREETGQVLEVTLEREYEGDDIQSIDSLNIPVAKIWPSFTSENWRTYFTYVSLTGTALNMRPHPPADEKRDYTEDTKGFAIYRTASFPEALICRYAFRNEKEHRPDEIRAVLPLVPPPKLRIAQRERAVAGIDLGSTGSIVFLKVGQRDASRFEIKPRLYSVTKENRAYELRTDREFFPSDDPKTPRQSTDILSVFQVHGSPSGGDQARLPVCDGHILYLKTPEQFIDDQTKNVQSNLKWGGSRERYLARDFLRQLSLQTAAEALEAGAEHIEWRFSYPTAFTGDALTHFREIWDKIVEETGHQTGVESTRGGEDIRSKYCEAVSSARYFSHAAAMDATVGALSIDIGGGTSDYAFWRNQALSQHNSVLLAGRDIFLAPLRQRPDLLSVLDKNLVSAISRIQKLRETPHSANAQLDAIIARKADELRMALNYHNEPVVQNFRGILELGLSGILYYGGLLLRRQILKDNFAPRDVYAIHVGGNGSNLFHWAAGHKFTEDCDMAIRLNEVFKKASGVKALVSIRLSQAPKSEVAYGLVNTGIPLKIDGASAEQPACERFMSGPVGQQKTYEWNETFPIDQLRQHGVIVDPNLPEFTEFLMAIGETMDVGQRATLVGRVNSRLSELHAPARTASDDQKALAALPCGEPIWIIAFKNYLENRINAWANSF